MRRSPARARRARRSPACARARARRGESRRSRSSSPKVRHSQRGTMPPSALTSPARSRAKYSSALRVFVSCSPERSTPCSVRNARVWAATSNASVVVAARRQLENPRAVRVDPDLGDEPALELRRDEAQLEDEDRPEDGQVVERHPFRRVLREQLSAAPSRRASAVEAPRAPLGARPPGRAFLSASRSRRTRREARPPRR